TNALAVHPLSGEIIVAGQTKSTDFPKTAGADQEFHAADGGLIDTFVTRLDMTLTTRLQSTYLGGNGNDLGRAMAIHPGTGAIYVAGGTASTDFPGVAGAEQVAKAGAQDAFVSRMMLGSFATSGVTVFEFFNTILQHYFRTAVVAEANSIDAG